MSLEPATLAIDFQAPSAAVEDGKETKDSQATILVRLAREAGAELFHDDGTPYLHFVSGDHSETHRLRSRTGRAWLIDLFLEKLDRAPGAQALADATNTLEAIALREGLEQKVYVRIAATDDRIYIDLADTSWRAVEITRTTWRLVSDPPVRFRRPKGILPIQAPQPGGTVARLRPFVNVATDDDFLMLVAVILAWLRGKGPYPVLVENGEQGTGKSGLMRVFKALIDPNTAPLRSTPREPRDLMIAAMNNHLLSFDNISDLTQTISDALCRLSTGDGFTTRTLYSDDEEMIFAAQRPVVLNGIPSFATKPDLVGRSVFVVLPPITDGQRRDEASYSAEFNTAQPFILGAFLDIVVVALRNNPMVKLDSMPRMADFAKWIVAAEPACPWEAGRFMAVYANNRDEAIEATLEGDPVADYLRSLDSWEGRSTDLLNALNGSVSDQVKNSKDWFKDPRKLAGVIRRLAPALRQVGTQVEEPNRLAGRRRFRITRLERAGSTSSPSSPSSLGPKTLVGSSDDAGDARPTSSPPSSLPSSSSPTSSPRFPNKTGPNDDDDANDDVEPPCSNGPPMGISPNAWQRHHGPGGVQ